MKIDYSKTFIYKLCCNDINIKDIYVGHSTDFKSRNQDHKKCCNNSNSKKYNAYKYQFIREHGGYENWKMIKLYDFPCKSKREAEAQEDKTMQELNATLNKNRAYTTKEDRIEYMIEYRNNNKKDIKEKTKEYYENNKDIINQHNKEYRENNKEYIKKYNQKYNEKLKNEKVKCEFCFCVLTKYTLKRHQKSMKCLKFQKCIIDDE